jgi:hypothetical protein
MRCGGADGAEMAWHRCSGRCHMDSARCSPSRGDVTAPSSRSPEGVKAFLRSAPPSRVPRAPPRQLDLSPASIYNPSIE